MKIAIGGDHAGYEYKNYLMGHLSKKGIECINFGTDSGDSVDYPDFAHPVSQEVSESKDIDFGILICGSANGVAMTANKHENIRAAICWKDDIAALARQHNNANIICIPARFVSKRMAWKMVQTFLNTPFEGGRHQRRVGKISCQ
ncbi:MAG: ribose 5-phosphate isomerase B [Saprospiraceae bacterium]|nr:ribose 5-phosphate isomerase B [Bacteroidia bacterium]NNE14880.1 ribose 5-phosphate isomerase B [Saprospiraceae bacterium]NNL93634.1 ribose 5-phosphate isomerase B [Saprospiraceae bacterium]